LKHDSSKQCKSFMTLFILSVVVLIPQMGYATRIVNYDNHPDLDKATRYGMQRGGADPNVANRELAEKHYLAYLKDIPPEESFQKARVYALLGDLYCGRVSQAVTKSAKNRDKAADDKKAAFYYRKVLEVEPHRIGDVIINAKASLSSLECTGAAEKLEGRLDYYNWVVSIDKEYLKDNMLPLGPDRISKKNDPNALDNLPSYYPKSAIPGSVDHFMKSLMKSLNAQEYVARMSLIRMAYPAFPVTNRPGDYSRARDILTENYQRMIDRCPGTLLAREARQELRRLSTSGSIRRP
jgi:hypothetical protein